MTVGTWNGPWARAFMEELFRSGVRTVCVAPGSRSTPLVLAAADVGRFRIYSIVDERSAGFFALGAGKASDRPAVVITTSGTATANLYPAVIEASQGESPLIVLTADRPHRLRDTDGNQAMDQIRLFGAFPRAFFEVEPPVLSAPSFRHLRGLAARAVAHASGPPAGPVHLNFPFAKPLEPRRHGQDPEADKAWTRFEAQDPEAALGREDGGPFVDVCRGLAEVSDGAVERLSGVLRASKRGLILAGPTPRPWQTGPAVRRLSAVTGFPVLADPLSGARFGDAGGALVVGGYDLFLRAPAAQAALEPDLILRIGGSLTSAGAMDYLTEHGGVRQIVVDDGWRWKDHPASAHEYVRASAGPLLDRLMADDAAGTDPGWGRLWMEAEERTRTILDDWASVDPAGGSVGGSGSGGGASNELLEGDVLAGVVRALPEGSNLLVASSMPVRDLDAFAFPGPRFLRVFGNRGTSGIDGLVSTTLGVAAGSAEAERAGGEGGLGLRLDDRGSSVGKEGMGFGAPLTVGVLGDLAFYHDMNGLLAAGSIDKPVVFVVINNDGGGIFQTLPVREHEPAFTRYFSTPHGLDFSHAARLYGIPFTRAGSREALSDALEKALAGSGPRIVEVKTRREETHKARQGLLEAVARAMEGLGET